MPEPTQNADATQLIEIERNSLEMARATEVGKVIPKQFLPSFSALPTNKPAPNAKTFFGCNFSLWLCQ
jgi:hypothetical protein